MRILVAESDPSLRAVTSETLERAGHAVTARRCGRARCARFRNGRLTCCCLILSSPCCRPGSCSKCCPP